MNKKVWDCWGWSDIKYKEKVKTWVWQGFQDIKGWGGWKDIKVRVSASPFYSSANFRRRCLWVSILYLKITFTILILIHLEMPVAGESWCEALGSFDSSPILLHRQSSKHAGCVAFDRLHWFCYAPRQTIFLMFCKFHLKWIFQVFWRRSRPLQ